MAYNFSSLKVRLREVEDWLGRELAGLRTGRATPLLLDNVQVESYGTRQPIKHLAAISIDDPRTLRVTPWDKTAIKNIETAIAAANLGVSTSPDSTGIRIVFPELTAERRQALLKVVKAKLEEAKISARKEREKVWSEIQDQERAGDLSEDDKFRGKEDLQKVVDEFQEKLLELVKKKEQELLS